MIGAGAEGKAGVVSYHRQAGQFRQRRQDVLGQPAGEGFLFRALAETGEGQHRDGRFSDAALPRLAFDPAAFAREKASLEAGLRQQKQGQLFQAYLAEARDRYAIERNAEAFKRVMGR